MQRQRFFSATRRAQRGTAWLCVPALMFVGVVFLAIWPFTASADTDDSAWSHQATALVASDYLFRGASQTMNKPSIQFEWTASHETGWYGSMWASNVDFVASPDPDDGARYEVDLSLGYWADIGDDIGVDVMATRLLFPGTLRGQGFNYTELEVSGYWRDRTRVTLGYTPAVYGSDSEAFFYEAEQSLALPCGYALTLTAGYFDLEDYAGVGYAYGSMSLRKNLQDLGLFVAQHWTDNKALDLYYASTIEQRLVAGLEYSF